MAELIHVASLDEIPEQGKKVIDIDGDQIAVFRVDGQYYAIQDLCTHDGGPLADGYLEGHEVVCPRHGAHFDIKTGKAMKMPAITAIQTYPVVIQDNQLFIKY